MERKIDNMNKIMFMKKLFMLFLGLPCILPVYAGFSGSTKAVTMESYEQSWLDNKGTLALKNNLSEDINNVAFRITYLDMSGKALDYAEFTREIHIAPGMTKKVNIPAYEYDRHYHYYKTKDEFGHPAFKIRFEMQDYNLKINKSPNNSEYDDYSIPDYTRDDNYLSTGTVLLGILAILFVIGISVGLYVLVAVMAQNRHRSVAIWIVLSLIATPLLMIIILFFIGEATEREL